MRFACPVFVFLAIWGLIASCSDGRLSPLVAGDGSVDSDSDIDTDSDTDVDSDSDSDTSTEPTCPLGSGYPCACDPEDGHCDDNSDCVTVGPSLLGMCLLDCGPGDPACQATDGYGVNGWCGFDAFGPPESNDFSHCIVTCQYEGDEGPCPPGLECVPHHAEGIPPQDICIPSF